MLLLGVAISALFPVLVQLGLTVDTLLFAFVLIHLLVIVTYWLTIAVELDPALLCFGSVFGRFTVKATFLFAINRLLD